jgi:acyl-CoA dehydrogenase
MNNIDSLNLELAASRFGVEYIEDICFARRIAFEIDADPLSIKNYKNEPTIVKLCNDRYKNCLERTKLAEAVGYGDANVFLACPNPSLAAGAIREMADQEHQDYFFEYIAKEHCTTFAGITEPKHGSDVASIETRLEIMGNGTYKINGEKCFITHGYDGGIAVLVARVSSGPLGISGIMLTQNDLQRGEQEHTLTRELLPVVGMKGTCLSRLVFNDFSVPAWNLLGQHLRATRRGMLAVIKTFNRMRPCVAGFVLGQGQGIVDYIDHCFKKISRNTRRLLLKLNTELATARKSLYQSAIAIDEQPLDSGVVSLSKAQITNLVEIAFSSLLDELGYNIFYEHPLLLKWFRDIYGFEYMEGTTDMQKRNVYQKFLRS